MERSLKAREERKMNRKGANDEGELAQEKKSRNMAVDKRKKPEGERWA